jgi:hypothetical protein
MPILSSAIYSSRVKVTKGRLLYLGTEQAVTSGTYLALYIPHTLLHLVVPRGQRGGHGLLRDDGHFVPQLL